MILNKMFKMLCLFQFIKKVLEKRVNDIYLNKWSNDSSRVSSSEYLFLLVWTYCSIQNDQLSIHLKFFIKLIQIKQKIIL